MRAMQSSWREFEGRCEAPFELKKKSCKIRTSICLREQVTGIERASQAWEACVLPLNHTCNVDIISENSGFVKQK